MEERRTPNKTLLVIGFIVSILFIGLGGLVLSKLLFGGYDFEIDIMLLAAMLVILGLIILVVCSSSLIGKKTIDFVDMFLIFFIIIGALCVTLGISENVLVFVLIGAFFVVPLTVLFIHIKRNQALIKKYGDRAQEIIQKKNKRGRLKVALTLVTTLVIAVSLVVVFIEPGPKSKSERGICGACDREYTDSDNKHSIARTGMCENCYGNFENFKQFIDR